MSKAKKYAVNGAIIVAMLNALMNAIKQWNEIKKDPNQQFDWKQFLIAAGKGAAVGGLGGLAIGAIVDHSNSKIKPINTDLGLAQLANKAKLDKSSPAYQKLNEKALQIANLLNAKYGGIIQSVSRLGSTEIGTALKDRFDIDLGVSFRANSFRSTEEMFFSVLSFLKKQIGKTAITKVRDQKKSVGVFFLIDGDEHKIDVVPCKLTDGGRGSGYLYVNDKSIFGSPTYTKTNIGLLRRTQLSPTQQQVAVVLKKWKDKNNLPMSSHLLQNLILDAFNYAPRVPNGITKKTIMVLKHIAKDLDIAVIRGKENTNNVITDIPQVDKEQIMRAAQQVVEDYEFQPNSIVSIIN